MATNTYIGKGKVHMGLYSGGPKRPVGNCSKLAFSVTEDEKELIDHQNPGGGQQNVVRRITRVGIDATMHELSPENLAMLFFGSTSAVTEAAVSNEVVRAFKGGLSPTANQIKTSASVTVTGAGGTPTYVAGTDYTVSAAGIYVPATSAIANDVNIEVDYTKRAADVVEVLTQAAGEYKLIFDGLNEAESGRPVTLTVHRMKFGAPKDIGWIGDDFAALAVSGEVLSDPAIINPGLSKYYKVVFGQ